MNTDASIKVCIDYTFKLKKKKKIGKVRYKREFNLYLLTNDKSFINTNEKRF